MAKLSIMLSNDTIQKAYAAELKANATKADKEIRFTSFDSLEQKLESTELVVAFFGSNWCKNTQRITPKYLEAQKLADYYINDSRFYLTKVECTTDGEITCTQKYKVQGYPTIFAYKNHKLLGEYPGGPNSTEIWKYLKDLATNELGINVANLETKGLFQMEGNVKLEDDDVEFYTIFPLMAFIALVITGAVLFKRARTPRNRYTSLPRYA